MHRYLSLVGMAPTSCCELSMALRHLSDAHAVVWFPDEFPPREVDEALTRMVKRRLPPAMVIVTGDPRKYRAQRSATEPGREAPRSTTTVLPKPIFGWTILDALRG